MRKLIKLLLLPALLFLLVSCSPDTGTPEEQIQKTISSMETAIEQRSLDSVRELVDDDYSDEWNGNRRSALRALMLYFQGHQSIHLLTRTMKIELNEDATAATVIIYVGMAGEPVDEAESLLNVKADAYRFEIKLRKEDEDWLVHGARWQHVRAEDFTF